MLEEGLIIEVGRQKFLVFYIEYYLVKTLDKMPVIRRIELVGIKERSDDG
jgi:hypothetical protein